MKKAFAEGMLTRGYPETDIEISGLGLSKTIQRFYLIIRLHAGLQICKDSALARAIGALLAWTGI